MNYIKEITTALLLLGSDDLEMARRYLEWMKVRRQVNDRFFFRAHWIDGGERISYHWVGL